MLKIRDIEQSFPLRHGLDAAVPLRSQRRVVQHGVNDAGAVRRLPFNI